jgi:hypothetical protein
MNQKIHRTNGRIAPDFVKIKQKHTKRLSPYSETEIWELEELLTIVKTIPNPTNAEIISGFKGINFNLFSVIGSFSTEDQLLY